MTSPAAYLHAVDFGFKGDVTQIEDLRDIARQCFPQPHFDDSLACIGQFNHLPSPGDGVFAHAPQCSQTGKPCPGKAYVVQTLCEIGLA